MIDHLFLLSVPGLREQDLASMPRLRELMARGERAELVPSFPSVTWPVQANMLTGKLPNKHGVVANGFYWRDRQEVEMWTAWNDKIKAPQIWDLLHQHDPRLTSAVWFPMLSKGCGADFVCMPAPVHNPDGSESLWCYTKPEQLYGELRDEFGHFPLQHFWGPLANIQSSSWIANSAIYAAHKYRPRFFFIYLPHLDYAAQRSGPDSPEAEAAVGELDEVIGRMSSAMADVFKRARLLWLVASEYVIRPINHVTYPNRVLREAGYVQVVKKDDGEHLDLRNSSAWALVDHQFAHVFVREPNRKNMTQIMKLFDKQEGLAEVLVGHDLAKYRMDHARSGEIILISQCDSWQAYYWWLDAAQAPAFARTVDIHRKPGYDPVELHVNLASKTIPLDATLVKGSHGAPVHESLGGVLLSSERGVTGGEQKPDTAVAEIVLRQFGVRP